jgi:hypothetical protein
MLAVPVFEVLCHVEVAAEWASSVVSVVENLLQEEVAAVVQLVPQVAMTLSAGEEVGEVNPSKTFSRQNLDQLAAECLTVEAGAKNYCS